MICSRFITMVACLGLAVLNACTNGPNSEYEEFGSRINTEGFGHRFAQPDDVDELVLGPGDVIRVDVAKLAEASSQQGIRQNGSIDVFYVGSVMVAGLTPSEVEDKISILITPFVKNPTVRVIPLRQTSQNVYIFARDLTGGILGRRLPITGDLTLVDLMINAFSGTPALADDCHVKVLRADPRNPQRWVINFRDIVSNGYSAGNIQMKPDDIVWLPQTLFAKITTSLNIVTQPLNVLSRTLRTGDDYRFLIEEGEFRVVDEGEGKDSKMATEVQTYPNPVATESEGPTILDYLGVFRRRWKTILIPAIIMAILGGVVAFIVPPQYEASTKFQVDDPGLLKDIGGFNRTVAPHKPLLNAIDDEIKSPSFLRPLISKVGITEGYNVSSPEEFLDLLKYINKNLDVQLDKASTGPDRVLIRYTGRNQAKVVTFVNEVRDAYADHFRQRYRGPSLAAYDRSADQVDSVERAIEELRAGQAAFLETPDASYLGRGPGLHRELESLQREKNRILRTGESLKREEAKASLQLKTLDKENVVKSFEINPRKEELRLIFEAAKGNYNRLAGILTDITDEVQQARAAMLAAQEAYEAEDEYFSSTSEVQTNKLYQQTEAQLLTYRRQIDGNAQELVGINKQIAQVESEIARVPEVEARAQYFRSALETKNADLRSASQRLSRTKGNWQQVRDSDLFRVVVWPESNEPPVFPSVPLFLGIGALAGLLMGVGFAFLKEFSGMTFATTAQVKSAMPLPVLGEVARIVSDAERREERARRTRTFLILAFVVIVIGTLHLFYFEKSLKSNLPSAVVRVMDKIYLGR